MREHHLSNRGTTITPTATLTTFITISLVALSTAGCGNNRDPSTSPSGATTSYHAQPGPSVTPSAISPSRLAIRSGLPSPAAAPLCRHGNPSLDYTGHEPPQAICVHTGARIAITLHPTSFGPWLPPANSASVIATFETPPTTAQAQMRLHLTARMPGTTTISTQTRHTPGTGAPTAQWRLTIRVIH